MLLAVAIAVVAGLWQYGTWNDDRAAAARTLVNEPAVPLATLMGGDSPFPGDRVGQPVTLTGTWMPAGSVYVSGQRHDGRTGYWAVTPVVVGTSAIPVVRGWAPRADAPAPEGEVTITGWLEPSEAVGEADTNPHDDVITSMRIASMTQHVDVDLYSAYVVAKEASTGLTGVSTIGPTHHPDVSGFTGLRNLLYALQWWVFGGLAIYIWWRWCQEQLHPREQDPDSDPAERSTPDSQVPSSP